MLHNLLWDERHLTLHSGTDTRRSEMTPATERSFGPRNAEVERHINAKIRHHFLSSTRIRQRIGSICFFKRLSEESISRDAFR